MDGLENTDIIRYRELLHQLYLCAQGIAQACYLSSPKRPGNSRIQHSTPSPALLMPCGSQMVHYAGRLENKGYLVHDCLRSPVRHVLYFPLCMYRIRLQCPSVYGTDQPREGRWVPISSRKLFSVHYLPHNGFILFLPQIYSHFFFTNIIHQCELSLISNQAPWKSKFRYILIALSSVYPCIPPPAPTPVLCSIWKMFEWSKKNNSQTKKIHLQSFWELPYLCILTLVYLFVWSQRLAIEQLNIRITQLQTPAVYRIIHKLLIKFYPELH